MASTVFSQDYFRSGAREKLYKLGTWTLSGIATWRLGDVTRSWKEVWLQIINSQTAGKYWKGVVKELVSQLKIPLSQGLIMALMVIDSSTLLADMLLEKYVMNL